MYVRTYGRRGTHTGNDERRRSRRKGTSRCLALCIVLLGPPRPPASSSDVNDVNVNDYDESDPPPAPPTPRARLVRARPPPIALGLERRLRERSVPGAAVAGGGIIGLAEEEEEEEGEE